MRLELSELSSLKANDDAAALRNQNGDLLKVTRPPSVPSLHINPAF